MKHTDRPHLSLFRFVLVSVLLGGGVLAAESTIRIVSPVAGVWANYQSLVLDLPEGTEAFYSLNGEDPSVSGLAYDGPVLLNISGNVRLSLVTVDSGGTRSFFETAYTVILKETPVYMKKAFTDSEGETPLVPVNTASHIDIPSSLSYTLGDTGMIFSGRRLGFSEPVLFGRRVPLVVYDGDIPFRYVLYAGADAGHLSASGNGGADIAADYSFPLEFIDWNYAVFKTEKPVVYSIDGEDMRVVDSGKIYIDRSKDRLIRWRSGDVQDRSGTEKMNEFIVPARPKLQGLPSAPVVNKAALLFFDDKDFMFCLHTADGRKLYAPVFTVDALEGDAFGFSQNIDVYYKGAKQGSVHASFIIDKIPPRAPVFVASQPSLYARTPFSVSVQSDAPVYYYAAPVGISQTGFASADIQKFNDSLAPVNTGDFSPLTSESLHLKAGEKEALLYTIYAYTRDAAGNQSEVVRFQKVIDTVNYYAVQKNGTEETTGADGSPDSPFADFPALYAAVQKSPSAFIRCFIRGAFDDLHSLHIKRDTQIIGDGKSRLCFAKGASLKVSDASFVLKDCTLEQNYGGVSDVFQTTLVEADNARLFFSGAELVCKDSHSVSCITISDSSLDMENSGVGVEASVYADALSARAAVLNIKDTRFFIIAQTAAGVKSVQSSSVIQNSSFRLWGNFVRALEFLDSGFTLNANSFTADASAASASALWTNMPLVSDLNGNVYEGFGSLYGGR